MTHLVDLARYDYHRGAPRALAVGWLDAGVAFTSGVCPLGVRERLRLMSRHPVRLMRGFHFCQFCLAAAGPRSAQESYADPDTARGNGEIWLTSCDGTNFAAPAMIAHYIDAHGYLPPEPFLDAVLTGGPTPHVS